METAVAIVEDRRDAGGELAGALAGLRGEDAVVLGLPRGGVPVAFEVARGLGTPLDLLVAGKLGVPFEPELGVGAVAEAEVSVDDESVTRGAGVCEETLEEVEARERAEVARRSARLQAVRPEVPVSGRTAVAADDELAAGSIARAACALARAKGARRVVLAVPVAPESAAASLEGEADGVVVLAEPAYVLAIGQVYRDFSQTSDAEVLALLWESLPAETAPASSPAPRDRPGLDEEVEVVAAGVRLAGRLAVSTKAAGLVVFAHGSGSGRHSPPNRLVAGVLWQAGFGTLLIDLLTRSEALDRSKVFDVELLRHRLGEATAGPKAREERRKRAVGYFGASTGAADAARHGAAPGAPVAAVVSRRGRSDLAGPWLTEVRAPILIIVGGADDVVLRLNRDAGGRLACRNKPSVVPGASHLFEGSGTLEVVAGLATAWYIEHLAKEAP